MIADFIEWRFVEGLTVKPIYRGFLHPRVLRKIRARPCRREAKLSRALLMSSTSKHGGVGSMKTLAASSVYVRVQMLKAAGQHVL